MSDYTPTTEEVRTGYSTATYDDSKAEAEFDRWLIQERQRVADMATKKERERILEELRTILCDSDVIDFYYDHINFDELDRQIRGEFL